MRWLQRAWATFDAWRIAHPMRFRLAVAAFSVIGPGILLVGDLGGALDFIKQIFGWNYTYAVIVAPGELRLGEEATVALVRAYKNKESLTTSPEPGVRCAWFYTPPLAGAQRGPDCDKAIIVADAAEFSSSHTARIDVHIAVKTYEANRAPPESAGAADAEGVITLLDQYRPDIQVAQPGLSPGEQTELRVTFAANATPSNPSCHWSIANIQWSVGSLIAEPDRCSTSFRVPRNAFDSLKIAVSVTTPLGETPSKAETSITVVRPPGHYFSIVMDYTERAKRQWADTQPMLDAMRDKVRNAIDYVAATGGGYVGITSFGGAPRVVLQDRTVAADCDNVRALYSFGPLEKEAARAAVGGLGPEGVAAPLARAIVQAYEEQREARDAATRRPGDRFLMVVLTAGPDSCGRTDLIGMLKDTMAPEDIAKLVIDNRMLRVVLAMTVPADQTAVDRLLASKEYNNEHQRTPILKVDDSTTLDRAPTDLAGIASRDRPRVASGCADLEKMFLEHQKDFHGAGIAHDYCRRIG